MSPESSKWLTKCINEVLINEHAVKTGEFHIFIKDIEHEVDYFLWKKAMSKLIMKMKERIENDGRN
jgi:hypothetical protein